VLKDEEREWNVQSIERMIAMMAPMNPQRGDISATAFRLQLKLRDLPGWPSHVRNRVAMLTNLVEIQHKYNLKLS